MRRQVLMMVAVGLTMISLAWYTPASATNEVEVAEHLAYDQSRVSQILSVARDKMRQRINGTVKPKAEAPSAARKRAFLLAFRETQNIPAACRASGISRGAPHRWRATDVEFDLEMRGVLGQTRPTPSKTP